jgi:hypothetical protein
MKDFEISFELFGKKMRTTISATNESNAKKIILDKIIFHKIVVKNDNNSDDYLNDFMGNDETFKNLMDIFGMNKK